MMVMMMMMMVLGFNTKAKVVLWLSKMH